MRRTDEEKIAQQLESVLTNHWFNPVVAASIIVNNFPLWTQDRLMDLIKEIIKQQAGNFEPFWEEGITSEALMLSSHLAEVISLHEPLV